MASDFPRYSIQVKAEGRLAYEFSWMEEPPTDFPDAHAFEERSDFLEAVIAWIATAIREIDTLE